MASIVGNSKHDHRSRIVIAFEDFDLWALAAHQTVGKSAGHKWHARFSRFADRGSFALVDI
ncbi:hypothetical protein MTX26_17980 [Bradyrhizobium sp. ISRA443]|uniref:hypothetical protein n=1 Tax=unclassified Bradyrhizobium TaxID=2631580 RepID=UPI0024784230|nr:MULTISPECIES: hypothetical protein [unclassified Bradyrhizobium]WGR96379.1 hypothetical protein MTX23_17990 [Bradyrhizobium sp. ISRA436]WGS03264.1 hypothetical protein MTX18_17980 [Bradyrhizobium sp. ISRA437]WGS10148.1 hypothetical protein MTX26_17980 [Bradyrhizobium sp. ISRA443]